MTASGSAPRVTLRGIALNAGYLGVVGLATWGGVLAFQALSFILLPFFVAVLLTALLGPLAVLLHRRLRFPAVLAAITTVLVALAFVGGLFAWIAPDVAGQSQKIVDQVGQGIEEIPSALHNLGVKDSDVQRFTETATQRLQDGLGRIGERIGTSVVSLATTVANVIGGVFLTLMMLIYLLMDGAGFWRGALAFAPAARRQALHTGGLRSWNALTVFVRSQVAVSAIDGIGVAVGLAIIGVPLAIPLGVMTFVLSLIPYVGAIIAGVISALVALSTNGLTGFIGAGVVATIVQQVEGNVLYPLLIGRSVKLHPISVLLGVGAGTALLGAVGAFLATPLIAAVAAGAGWLEDEEDLGSPAPEEVAPPEEDPLGGPSPIDGEDPVDATGGARGSPSEPAHRPG